MQPYSLAHLSNAELLCNLKTLVARERGLTAVLLAHVAEIDKRRLYAPAGFSSMFRYCVSELRMSEGGAWRRIQAARAARKYPALLSAVAEGRLHLTAICLVAPHLKSENVQELIAAAQHRAKSEIQVWLACRFPDSSGVSPITTIRPITTRVPDQRVQTRTPIMFEEPNVGSPNQPTLAAVNSTTSVAVVRHPEPQPAESESEAVDTRLHHASNEGLASPTPPPPAPEHPTPPRPSFRVQVTIPESTHGKLRHAQALLSHAVDPRDVAQLLDRALDALIEKYEKRRLGAAPRSASIR